MDGLRPAAYAAGVQPWEFASLTIEDIHTLYRVRVQEPLQTERLLKAWQMTLARQAVWDNRPMDPYRLAQVERPTAEGSTAGLDKDQLRAELRRRMLAQVEK